MDDLVGWIVGITIGVVVAVFAYGFLLAWTVSSPYFWEVVVIIGLWWGLHRGADWFFRRARER